MTQPMWAPPPVAPTPKKRHPLRWILGIGGTLILIIVIAAVAGGGSPSSKPSGVHTASAAPAPTTTTSAAPQDTSPVYVPPTAKWFKVTLKETEKQCFGDAGCIVTYKPSLELKLPYLTSDLDPAVTYDITYDVRGAKDPGVGTISATGGQYTTDETVVQTDSPNAKLTATVTSVEPE